MNKVSKFFINHRFTVLYTVIWCFFSILALVNHELWRDSIRPWAIIDIFNVPILIKTIILDGHPFLWYLILFPFVKLGFNISFMKVISFCAVLPAIVLFLEKSPFNMFIKFLFVFSAGMIYYIPVIPRSYCLIPILLFACAYLYPQRHKIPTLYLILLFLISQTHANMYAFFFISSVIFFYERFKSFPLEKVRNITYLLIFTIYNIFNIIIYTKALISSIWIPSNFKLFSLTFYAFSPVLHALNSALIKINPILYKIFILALVLYILTLFKLNKKSFSIVLISILWMLIIFLKIWFGGVVYQKLFLIILVIIYGAWITPYPKNIFSDINKLFLTVILLINFFHPFFIDVVKEEVKASFSDSIKVVNYISDYINNAGGGREKSEVICIGSCSIEYFIILAEQLDIPADKIIDNKTIDSYINNAHYNNPKIIVISNNYKVNLKSPYKRVYFKTLPPFKYHSSLEYYYLYRAD